MLLRQFYVDVIPKHSADEDEILRAEAWVYDDDEFDSTVDEIRQLAWQFGYELVNGGEICRTDSELDLNPTYVDDRFSIIDEY